MKEPAFWAIIEAGGPYPLDAQEDHLASIRDQLLAVTPNEVEAFYKLFCQRMIDAQTWDMWGAAYLINGGCSDDGFVYFRAWLIAQGRNAFEAALAHPDSLAGIVEPDRDDHEFEMLYALPQEVYEELSGNEMPDIDLNWPSEPAGKRWDFDDDAEVARRIPKLSAARRE